MEHTNHPDLESAVDRDIQAQLETVGVEEEEHYFKHNHAPDYLPILRAQIEEFLTKNTTRKIAVITSGGTTVPLENNTVRFIDNFSAGTRGSVSAEWFLDNGYAVLFVHREFSLMPFSHNYMSHGVLDLFTVENNELKVNFNRYPNIKNDVKRHHDVKTAGLLLEIPFTTVHQYLHTLRMIGEETAQYGTRILFYLAAAVSDFFIPVSKLSEHKIQSSGMGKLVVDLDPVPKFLRALVQKWTPGAMVVSFKLETDESILLSKCRAALTRYGHQLVAGNLLQTRKDEIWLVSPEQEKRIVRGKSTIEDEFLPCVVAMHDKYIAGMINK